MANSHIDDLLAEAPWLRRFAAGLVRSAADADDLVQDTLSAALAVPRGVEPEGGLPHEGASGRGLLAGIARNLARANRRSDGRRAERELRHSKDSAWAAAPSADEDAQRLDLLRALLDELAALPPAQRRALTARFLDELEPAQIAERDGVSPSSVRSQLARGLAVLRERMDQRGAGREQWLGCLGPWAMRYSGFPVGLQAAPSMQAAATSTSGTGLPTAATTPSPILAGMTGLLLMKTTLWLASIVSIPALLAALWWLQADPVPSGPEGTPTGTPASAAGPDMAQVPDAGPRNSATATAAPPKTTLPEQAEQPVALESAEALATALVVDMLTGEPVPHFGLEVLHYPTLQSRGDMVRSDAQGNVEIDSRQFPGVAQVRLIEKDRTNTGQKASNRQSEVAIPFTEPIPVHVGPTFTFDLPQELQEDLWSVSVRFRAVDDTDPSDDPRAGLREGHRPWVRFPREVTELQGDSFELVFEAYRDSLTARVPVTRSQGVEPEVLRPTFEQRGSARFILPGDNLAKAPSVKVDLYAEGHVLPAGIAVRATLSGRGEDGSNTGTLRMLPPGNYTWSVVGAVPSAHATFTVFPGETTDVIIKPEALGATFSSEVLIDASAAPDARVAKWVVMVTSDHEPGTGFKTRPIQVEGAPAQFLIPLRALANGTWRVAVHPQGGATVAPSIVVVTPGAPPEVLRVLPGLGRASLTLSVVDAATDLPVQLATAAVLIIPKDVFEFTPADTAHSILTSTEVPRGGPLEIFVRAPGYRGEAVLHDPDSDGDQREVRLTRGWRSRVIVINVATMAPASGIKVQVDGKDAGTTGPDGTCWIEAETPPLLIEVGQGHETLKVVGTSDQNLKPGEFKTDPTFGFLFQMEPKSGGKGR